MNAGYERFSLEMKTKLEVIRIIKEKLFVKSIFLKNALQSARGVAITVYCRSHTLIYIFLIQSAPD